MILEFPKIYPITDRRLTGMTHLDQVRRLIGGGATLIQLREKHLSPREFFADAENAVRAARDNGVKIIINDRVDIALALGADGVHLGQEDLSPAKAREILGPEAIIGFSTHNLHQVGEATRLPLDYLAIGPVFATATKENPDPVVGLAGVRVAVSNAAGKPVVAIGGIGGANFRDILAAGAKSVAMISSILLPAETIEVNFRNLVSSITTNQHS